MPNEVMSVVTPSADSGLPLFAIAPLHSVAGRSFFLPSN